MGVVWNWTWGAVAFGSELAALAALAVGGWALPVPTAVRLLAAVGAPVVAAVLWGLFASPQAPVQVLAVTVVVKVVVLGGAVAALAATGHARLAAVLAVAAVLGTVLSPSPAALVSPPTAA
ncbi:DUF2568 domain-containing protein [Blastococcus sp. SYSU D00669]